MEILLFVGVPIAVLSFSCLLVGYLFGRESCERDRTAYDCNRIPTLEEVMAYDFEV